MTSAVEQRNEKEVSDSAVSGSVDRVVGRMPTPESLVDDSQTEKPTLHTAADPTTPTSTTTTTTTLTSPMSPTPNKPLQQAEQVAPMTGTNSAPLKTNNNYGRGPRRYDSSNSNNSNHSGRRMDKRSSFTPVHNALSPHAPPHYQPQHQHHQSLPPQPPFPPSPHHHPHHGQPTPYPSDPSVMAPPPPGHFAHAFQDPNSYNIAAAAAHAAAAAAGVSPYSDTPPIPTPTPQQPTAAPSPDSNAGPVMPMPVAPYQAYYPPPPQYFIAPNGMLYPAHPPPPGPNGEYYYMQPPQPYPIPPNTMPPPPHVPMPYGQPTTYYPQVPLPPPSVTIDPYPTDPQRSPHPRPNLPTPSTPGSTTNRSDAPPFPRHHRGPPTGSITPPPYGRNRFYAPSAGYGTPPPSASVGTSRRASSDFVEDDGVSVASSGVTAGFGSFTNLYVRGLMGSATDEWLFELCRGYGTITSSKAIVDLTTRECKGFGFVMYETEGEARAAMDGLMKQGYQVSFAKTDPRTPSTQESFNARLQNLQDEESTNIYVSNLPLDMDEEGLKSLFLPHKVISNKILRDGNHCSRGVGFARMETRVDAVNVIEKLNGTYVPGAPQKLQVRFADSSAQKRLKMQHQQVQGGRRKYRSGEFGRGEFRGRYFEGSVNGEEEEERSEYSFYEEGGRGQHGVIISPPPFIPTSPLLYPPHFGSPSPSPSPSHMVYGYYPAFHPQGPTPPPVIVPFDEFEEKVKVETRESFVTVDGGEEVEGVTEGLEELKV